MTRRSFLATSNAQGVARTSGPQTLDTSGHTGPSAGRVGFSCGRVRWPRCAIAMPPWSSSSSSSSRTTSPRCCCRCSKTCPSWICDYSNRVVVATLDAVPTPFYILPLSSPSCYPSCDGHRRQLHDDLPLVSLSASVRLPIGCDPL